MQIKFPSVTVYLGKINNSTFPISKYLIIQIKNGLYLTSAPSLFVLTVSNYSCLLFHSFSGLAVAIGMKINHKTWNILCHDTIVIKSAFYKRLGY